MAKKSTKIITWQCDKIGCETRNTREIDLDIVIYDDLCDFCHKAIHEPITIDLAIIEHNKKKGKSKQ